MSMRVWGLCVAALVALGSGCLPVGQLDDATADAAKDKRVVWMPISTALKMSPAQRQLPMEDTSDWLVETRPDFMVTLEHPDTWLAELHSSNDGSRSGLSFNIGDSPGAYHTIAAIHRRPDNEVGDYMVQVPDLLSLKNPHVVDAGLGTINGMEVRIAEFSGILESVDFRYSLVVVAMSSEDGYWTVVTFLVKSDRYREMTPTILAFFDKAQSTVPAIAARAKNAPAPVVRAAPTGWPVLSEPLGTGQADGAQDAAVVVGVEDYFMAPDIPGARLNAQDWFIHLRQDRGVPLGHIRLLKDNEATVEEMEAAAKAMAAKVGPGGTLWFVFVGHGAPAPDGQDGVLVGVDAQQTARSIDARSLPQQRLLKILSAGRQQHTVVVIDACFSGQTPSGSLAPGLQPMVPVRSRLSQKEVTVLSAGASDQFAGPLPGAERPAFSYLVLGAMRGWGDQNGDGVVTGSEALGYTVESLSAVVVGRTQTPSGAGKMDVALSSGLREAAPNLDSIVMGR